MHLHFLPGAVLASGTFRRDTSVIIYLDQSEFMDSIIIELNLSCASVWRYHSSRTDLWFKVPLVFFVIQFLKVKVSCLSIRRRFILQSSSAKYVKRSFLVLKILKTWNIVSWREYGILSLWSMLKEILKKQANKET